MDFLFSDAFGTPLWLWGAFLFLIVTLLVLDLGVLNRGSRVIGVARSLRLSAFYIAVGLAFGAVVWSTRGAGPAMDYWTGFLVEKTLAMDNLFVIAMIFAHLGVPRESQHRVLFWGILGVIVLRAIMIGLGAAVVHNFEWVLHLFAAFLVFTGVKMLVTSEQQSRMEDNALLAFLRRRMRVTEGLHGEAFFVRQPDPVTGRVVRYVTPLFVALVMVEVADVIFAVDSIPAILAITTDPFIVYTSNIFAILGLRALFFALAAMVDRFHYLKYALGVLLVFIGSKIFVAEAMGLDKIPAAVSLGVTIGVLTAGVLFSLWRTRPGAPAATVDRVAAE